MTTKENLIYFNPNKHEVKVPHLNGQKPLNYGNAKHLEEKHNAEKKKVFINYLEKVKEVRHETKEHLNKEQLIHNAKTKIYEKMGIDNNLGKNSPVENFLKGVIDELVIGNYDLAIEIYNTDGKVLLDALNQLSSWEGIKGVAEGLKESVVKLTVGNAYEKGKSFVELGLVSTGAFVGFKIAKFGIKKLKHIDIPKHHFDKLSVSDIAKMSDPDRIEVARFFMKNHFKKDISKDQENAIIAAHKVGENREGAGIHNYNFSEKGEKLKILEKAGFTKGERKLLLEKGVCGKPIEYKIISKDDLPIKIPDFIKTIDTYGEDILGDPDNIKIINSKIDEFIAKVGGESTPSGKQYLELKKQVSHILEKKGYLTKLNGIEYKKSEQLFYGLDKKKIAKGDNGVIKENGLEQLTSYNKAVETLKYSDGLEDFPKLSGKIDLVAEKQKILDADITLTGINEIIRDHSFYENMTLMHKEILEPARKSEILNIYTRKNLQTERVCKFAMENYDKLNVNQKVVLRVYLSQIVKNSYILKEKIGFKNNKGVDFITQASTLLEGNIVNKTIGRLGMDRGVMLRLQEVRDKRLESNRKIVAYN